MKEKLCGIYVIINTITLKEYIGKSIDIYRRFYDHKTRNDNMIIHKAIKKYGWEKFDTHIIELCNKDELNSREQYWIKKLNTQQTGYNIAEGGQGGLFGELNGMYGKHHTEESKHKMSVKRKGKQSWSKGLTKETDVRINEMIKKTTVAYHKWMEENREMIIEYTSRGGKIGGQKNIKRLQSEEFRKATSIRMNSGGSEHLKSLFLNEDYKKMHSENTSKAMKNNPEIIEKCRLGGLHTKGLVWINNGKEQKRINKSELSNYLSNGWKSGRGKIHLI